MQKEWETKNHNNAAAIEQAAKDKHLFYHVPRQRHIELKYPEYVHHSPFRSMAAPGDESLLVERLSAIWQTLRSRECNSPSSELPAVLHNTFLRLVAVVDRAIGNVNWSAD